MLLQIDGLMGMRSLIKSDCVRDPKAFLVPYTKGVRKRYALMTSSTDENYSREISDYSVSQTPVLGTTLRRINGSSNYTGMSKDGVYYNAKINGTRVMSMYGIKNVDDTFSVEVYEGVING